MTLDEAIKELELLKKQNEILNQGMKELGDKYKKNLENRVKREKEISDIEIKYSEMELELELTKKNNKEIGKNLLAANPELPEIEKSEYEDLSILEMEQSLRKGDK